MNRSTPPRRRHPRDLDRSNSSHLQTESQEPPAARVQPSSRPSPRNGPAPAGPTAVLMSRAPAPRPPEVELGRRTIELAVDDLEHEPVLRGRAAWAAGGGGGACPGLATPRTTRGTRSLAVPHVSEAPRHPGPSRRFSRTLATESPSGAAPSPPDADPQHLPPRRIGDSQAHRQRWARRVGRQIAKEPSLPGDRSDLDLPAIAGITPPSTRASRGPCRSEVAAARATQVSVARPIADSAMTRPTLRRGWSGGTVAKG